MGLKAWWRENRRRSAAVRRSVAINNDQQLIAQQVPELVGMSDVEGMAYVLQQIQAWNLTCSKDEAATFAGRLIASTKTFDADSLTMPYWGNLWVLRNYQKQLGFDVPSVAPAKLDPIDEGRLLGEDGRLALDRYIETHIVPRRQSFIDIFEDQISSLDQRLIEFNRTGQISREELAKIDYQILQDNWCGRRGEQIEEALKLLEEYLRCAETIGCGADFRSALERELSRQEAILVSEGLTILLRVAS